MRIVTTTCSNTELVCALGHADWLVGVDDHSDYPPRVVAGLPRVGPDLGVDPARIAALRPDLVLASLTVPGHEQVVASLRDAGLPVIATEPTSLADVYADLRLVAGELGCAERGARLAREMAAAMPQRTPSRKRKLLVQWWPKPVIAAGQLSWVQQLIELAGAANALGHRAVKSEPLDDAAVAALDPDAIIIAWCGVKPEKYRPEVIYRNPAFAGMRALRQRCVYCIAEGHLGRPSPRLIDGYRDLCRVLDEIGEN